MNSKILSEVKSKFNKYLKDKEIKDIVLFGSSVKGKANPNDIDIAFITDKKIDLNLSGFHISFLSIDDFFKPVSLVLALRGKSLCHGCGVLRQFKNTDIACP